MRDDIQTTVANGAVLLTFASALSTTTKNLSPAEAYELARHICDAAYSAQGGPPEDPEKHNDMAEEREKRKASWFEELYCTIRRVADDWHRESKRRHSGALKTAYTKEFLDPAVAVDKTGEQVVNTVKDWDY